MHASLIGSFLLGLLGVSGCVSAPASAPSAKRSTGPCATGESVALVAVHVIPMDSEHVLERQTVIVCEGKIQVIGPADSTELPPSARVIHAEGKYLIPGLADMHTHLLHEEDLALYIARGVTSVRNMWGAPIHLSWRARIERGELRGPTIYTAGPIMDGDPPVHDGSFVVVNEDDAKRAVAMQKQAGYDFLKVYSRLSRPAYDAIMAAAREAHMSVAGHVPRAVGLEHVIASGQRSVEHLEGFVEALQRDDSPVKGKWDRESRAKKLDFIDETKLPALVRSMRERGVWSCPTRTVKDQMGSADEVRSRLARNDSAYIPPADRAIWRSSADPDARALALDGRLLVALREAGARVVVGTDPGNPLVVPGFSVHDELLHLVRAGFTPYQALRAATHDAAEMLNAESQFGTIAVGHRADLLLLDENPLTDVSRTQRIAGVMARGRWFSVADLATLLSDVRAAFEEGRPLFSGRPPLTGSGDPEFAATYRVTWSGAPFGAERAWIGRRKDGTRILVAERDDPHTGDTFRLSVEANANDIGQRLSLVGNGPSGQGRLDAVRDGKQARLEGRLLSGPAVKREVPIQENTLFSADRFLAGYLQLGRRVTDLEPGKTIELAVAEAQIGSSASLGPKTWRITRLPDAPEAAGLSRYAIRSEHDPPSTLTLDKKGCVRFELEVFGSTLRYERVDEQTP